MKRQTTVEEFSARINGVWATRRMRHAAGPHAERHYSIPAMGMMGEAGEAGEHFKKFIRDGKPVLRNRKLALELGDTLHYLCRCIELAGYSLSEICVLNERKIARREKRKVKHG